MTASDLLVKVRIQGAEKAKSAVDAVGASMRKTGQAAKSMGSAAAGIPKIFSTIAAAVSGPIAKILELTTVVTALGVALAAMVGGAGFNVATRLDSLTRGLASVSTGVGDLMGQLAAAKQLAKLPGLGFEEAVQGKVRLEAVGIAAQLADRSLMAFGNALASVGSGKAELDGVTLALSQIASKGKVSAEEINQISERVPQIRAAMIAAFGTADTEVIQKIGLDTTQFISGVVTELEKLPKVTGGIGNALENLSDRFKEVVQPLGQGLATAFLALQPTIERVAAFMEERFTRLGEIIAAVANSGVLDEVATRLMNVFDSLFGGDFTEGAIKGISNLLSVIANLPEAFLQVRQYASDLWESLKSNAMSVGTFLGALFQSIGQNIVAGFQVVGNKIEYIFTRIMNGAQYAFSKVAALMAPLFNAMAANPLAPQVVRDFSSVVGGMLGNFKPSYQKLPTLGPGEGQFTSLPGLPKLTGLPDLPKLNLLSDSARFAEMTTGAMKGLPTLPDGLNFGGGGVVSGEKSPIEATLERIERNTKSAADALSLRRQALGGGELAQLGVTPAELRGNRGNPNAGATRGSIGLDSSVTGLARSLDYITKRRVQESMNRLGGGGFRPRTG